jgi:HEAT repeat protein
VVTAELGAGLGSASQELAHPDAARRLEAVKRLTHPPSPLHLAGLLRLLESEKDPEVLAALSGGLGFVDSAIVMKSMGWARRESEPHRRAAAFSILRGAGDRAAFEFLAGWFEESPPATHPDRAAFASLFRQFHASSIPYLKELLTRNRSPRIQTEAIRQLGVVGDKAGAPMLVKTLSAYTKDSAVSLLKIGKPGIPTLLEGARSTDNETRRVCHYFLQKFTGIRQQNLSHFETWWSMNRKTVQEEEKAWWDEQSKKDWPVDPKTFATYDLPMESIVP